MDTPTHAPPYIGLDYSTCRQGHWDDCWLISALVSLAFKRPNDVLDMIRANPDGTFAVTLPGKEPVSVRPDEGVSSSDGVWAPVIEAAVGKHTNVTTTRMLQFGQGITLLTGNGTKWSSNVTGAGFGPLVPIPFNDNTLPAMLATAEERKRVVVLGGSDGYWTTVKVEGLVHRHCYAILAYEAADGHARVRDPAGDDGRIPNNRKKLGYGPGEFWLTLDEVESSFCGLAIERN
ncbi:MAG: hypothetical protein FJ304_20180 [Planctomycetes bacterium]|nr:hypothetical protein [Planctomycetota bacterium]